MFRSLLNSPKLLGRIMLVGVAFFVAIIAAPAVKDLIYATAASGNPSEWPGNYITCPKCGGAATSTQEEKFRYTCLDCGHVHHWKAD